MKTPTGQKSSKLQTSLPYPLSAAATTRTRRLIKFEHDYAAIFTAN
jgi:hypothetical protein